MLTLGGAGVSHGVPGALGVPSSQKSASLENDPVEFLRRGGAVELSDSEDTTGIKPRELGVR